MHDWETDPRPFADVLKDWAARINGGSAYGARPRAAEELRVEPRTLAGWMAGRPCSQERAMRRLMAMIEALEP